MNATNKYLIGLTLLLLPAFWLMFRPGIFSMQDYHTFRLYEFNKCVDDRQIPCRWTPNATFEYGQPTFNYYGQTVYVFGQIFRLVGFGVIDTIKLLFIFSIILSAGSMFLLARSTWGNNLSALVAALIYTYAPYRAVDIYVRGALPEAFGFVYFPLIVLFFNEYLKTRQLWKLLMVGLFSSLLVTTHNLSAFMFLFWFVIWGTYKLIQTKSWHVLVMTILTSILSFGLGAFYLLPVIFESQFIKIDQTVTGFYNFNNHFATLWQLFGSRFWGYGASVWESNDGLSLAVGQIHWILPLLFFFWLILTKKLKSNKDWLVLFGLGWLMLFLTHNKSVVIWNLIRPMEFIQFPWRFLGLAVFSFSLSIGAIVVFIKSDYWRKVSIGLILTLVLVLNISYFQYDYWIDKTDEELFSGPSYEDQISSSYNDYYPSFAKVTPNSRSSNEPLFFDGYGEGVMLKKNTHEASYHIKVFNEKARVTVPIAYFPGWVGFLDSSMISIYPDGDYGLISMIVPSGEHQIDLVFKNTLIRDLGNGLSIFSLGVFILVLTVWGRKKI